MIQNPRTFEVRDLRKKGFFMIDDTYLNGYAKIFGPTASMIYFSLCRHADKEQRCFPAQKLIGEELNVNQRTVIRMIKKLREANLIEIKKIRTNEGKWLNNTYILLDKSVWKTKEELNQRTLVSHGQPCDKNDIAIRHPCHIKETHKKETHTLSNMGEEQFESIANFYKVPIAFVRSKFDDLVNYCEANGKKYKNYYAALRNWVKKDAIKEVKEYAERNIKAGADYSNL